MLIQYLWCPSLTFPYILTEMTEEEQFALALKMSEQEAREVNSQEEEEEELGLVKGDLGNGTIE